MLSFIRIVMAMVSPHSNNTLRHLGLKDYSSIRKFADMNDSVWKKSFSWRRKAREDFWNGPTVNERGSDGNY